jgi:hypothetical protein
VKKEVEHSSRNAQKRNSAFKGHGAKTIKGKRAKSARSVQKTQMQTEKRSVA